MIHFTFGAVTVVIAYVLIRGAARFILSPAFADWMDRRAMIAMAESDAVAAARDAVRLTCERWERREGTDAAE